MITFCKEWIGSTNEEVARGETDLQLDCASLNKVFQEMHFTMRKNLPRL